MSGLKVKNRELGTGKPCICVPVMERTREGIIREIAYLAGSCADMIEWRVDRFEGFLDYNAVREILEEAAPLLHDKLFLYTFRTKRQGGEAEIEADTLNDLHQLAAESHVADFIDLEFFEEERPFRKIRSLQAEGVRVIASHHDFEETPAPEVMRMLLDKMCEGGADIVKLAVMPKTRSDVLSLLRVTGDFMEEVPNTPVITMSMGKLGSFSRLCGETFGSCVSFGAHRQASAPGQFEMNHLSDILTAIHESFEMDEEK